MDTQHLSHVHPLPHLQVHTLIFRFILLLTYRCTVTPSQSGSSSVSPTGAPSYSQVHPLSCLQRHHLIVGLIFCLPFRCTIQKTTVRVNNLLSAFLARILFGSLFLARKMKYQQAGMRIRFWQKTGSGSNIFKPGSTSDHQIPGSNRNTWICIRFVQDPDQPLRQKPGKPSI